ncbi:hypothetical protein CsSME_00026597 [Camellia sinensis var. sinensis]
MQLKWIHSEVRSLKTPKIGYIITKSLTFPLEISDFGFKGLRRKQKTEFLRSIRFSQQPEFIKCQGPIL